jgi:dienelactone hydrolase
MKMNATRRFASAAAAGIAMTIVTSACGTTTASRHATSRSSHSPAVATSTPQTTTAVAPSLLPEPTGGLAVGVRTVPSVSPAATTRVWYPARRGTGTGAPIYLADKTAAAYGLPATQLESVVPRASVNAEPAPTTKARAAVVLMPGWGLPMTLSTALAQDLASNGYVVVTVDPAFGTEDQNTLPPDTAYPGRRLDQISAALDFATGPRISRFTGPVDPNKIAVGGHSIAGAIAFQVTLSDPRVDAVFDLDGWLHGPALATPVAVPALMIDASGLEPATRAVIAHTATAVTVKLAGATHLDVTDIPCLVPGLGAAARVIRLGSIGCAGTTTTNAVVLRFLDAVLRDAKTTPSAASLTRGLTAIR